MLEDPGHIPVLPDSTIEAMRLAPGQTVLDATMGRGGHASLILPQIQGGTYIGLDVDPGNLAYASQRIAPIAAAHNVTVLTRHTNFRALPQVLTNLAETLHAQAPGTPLPEAGFGPIDRLLADIGFASNQVDDPARGMQFRQDGPLDMRLDPTSQGPTAKDLVNQLEETALANLIYELGEDRLSRRIAKRIVDHRTTHGPIETTSQLADLIRMAYPPAQRGGHGRGGKRRTNPRAAAKIDPATRTFMALRIAVNDELGALDDLLAAVPNALKPGGLAAIIGFHSLEDRRVKQAFLKWQQQGLGERLTRKPIVATDDEISQNSRSRSAKLRVWQRSDQAQPQLPMEVPTWSPNWPTGPRR